MKSINLILILGFVFLIGMIGHAGQIKVVKVKSDSPTEIVKPKIFRYFEPFREN